ncbi:alpha-mannosidase 2x isoform X2 [Strongylocentrotus purpuratus]|uniref:Alpha-mannosidase n=1 Tax=Strongylocentrotus purpuratus TaxID=7668 RepID=A0A7M7MY97_STRPU|nr:alpha-mannosidase 2x isoform X2 [Strongylocentrotus purpuratus]
MRSSKLVFVGLAIIIVVIMSMYLMLDQTGFPQEFPGQARMSEQDIALLESKVTALEGDLSKNHMVISQLRDAVRSLAKGQVPSNLDALVKPIDSAHHVQEQEGWFGFGKKKGPGPGLPMGGDPAAGGVANHKDQFVVAEGQVHVEPGECKFANTPSGNTTDVQMMQVYEKLRFDNANGGVWKQGFDISYDHNKWNEDPLKIFVVPHSHNDPGWIKTFTKYFTDQTSKILDTMVKKMEEHPKMTFIWAEISYLSMWWEKADNNKRQIVKKLVQSGRLEIVTGGWVMSDEANTNYFAMVDQMIEGHEWLDAFLPGVKPKSGWAIDPFGMSPTMAYVLQRMGLEAMIIQRVHYEIKKYFAQQKTLEFMWRQNWDHGTSTDMFCHMMPFYSYDVPHTCGPDPKVCCQFDFKRLPGGRINCPWKIAPVPITDANVASKAEILLDQYRKKSELYKSNVLLIQLGDDFRYDKPEEWDNQYKNYMKLFEYMNKRTDWHVQAQFGTLTDYFTSLWQHTNTMAGQQPEGYPTLSGDFFTYTDRDDHYWSGYYTSRPFYKNMDRALEGQLRAAEIMFTYTNAQAKQSGTTSYPSESLVGMLTNARRQLGLFQHHDGITGTAKDHVVVDYGNRMLNAINEMRKVMMTSIHYLLSPDKKSYHPQASYFDVDEERQSHDAMPTKKVLKLSSEAHSVVVFYNSLAQHRKELVRLHVSSPNVVVTDSDGNAIESQANILWETAEHSFSGTYELVFVVEIGPLTVSKYLIRDMGSSFSQHHHLSTTELYHGSKEEDGNNGPFKVRTTTDDLEEIKLENSHMDVLFDGKKGMLKSILTKTDNHNIRTNVEIEFVTYGTGRDKTKSGAYLFMPDGDAHPLDPPSQIPIRVTRGPLESHVDVILYCVRHTVILSNTPGADGTALSIKNILDIRNMQNKELVMRIKSDVRNSDRVFYTDLNGFQMQKRKILDKLPLQAHFYPMPAMAYIEDSSTRLTLHSAQPLGVSGLKEGWLEVVLDRRLMQDDSRGLQQGVTDNKLTPDYFLLQVERRHMGNTQASSIPISYPSLQSHHHAASLNNPIYIHHGTVPEVGENSQNKLLAGHSFIDTTLPCDVHLLNFRTRVSQETTPLKPKREALLILHRKGFDCGFPTAGIQCATNEGRIDPSSLLSSVSTRGVVATSLSAMYDGQEVSKTAQLEVEPMELKTYKVQFQ